MKRCGSTSCKADKVENFDELKREFLERIEDTLNEHDIPSNLIINWDHAGLNIVSVSNWTMAAEGSKRVEISGLGANAKLQLYLQVFCQVCLLKLINPIMN